jgi:hypothetical protein
MLICDELRVALQELFLEPLSPKMVILMNEEDYVQWVSDCYMAISLEDPSEADEFVKSADELWDSHSSNGEILMVWDSEEETDG